METRPTLSLTLAEFTQMALDRSLRSRINEENLQNSRWTWLSGERRLTWPKLSATGSTGRTTTNTDLGSETETDSQRLALSLTQPFLTGTDLTFRGTLSETDAETESLGFTTVSETRQRPDVSASLRQPLFLFVKNDKSRAWRTNRIQWENNGQIHRLNRLSIEVDAHNRYHGLLLRLEAVDIERRALERVESLRGTAAELKGRGRLPEVELARVEIRAKEDNRRFQNAETDYERAQNEAKDFILMPKEQVVIFTSRLIYEPFHPALEQLLQAAEETNPSLAISRNNRKLSEIDLQQVREGDRPRMDLTGTYGRTFDGTAGVAQPYTWDARLGLDWSIFDGTQTRLATYRSQSALRNAERNFENDRRQIRLDVESAFLELKRIEGQIVDFEKERETAEANVGLIRERFRLGQSSLTDAFDALDNLRRLEFEHVSLLVNFNLAKDRLRALVGREL